MKKLLTLFLLFATNFISSATTFTFHACRDNWTEISVLYGNSWQSPVAWQIGYWDYGNDVAFPVDAYSGLEGEVNEPGYKDTLTFSSDYPVAEVDVWIAGGYPSYHNYQMNFDLQRQPEGGVDLIDGGEVWIDFGPDGIGRIELIKPADFGKWAWDGSINSSWVEPPLAPVQQGKRLAKGHNK